MADAVHLGPREVAPVYLDDCFIDCSSRNSKDSEQVLCIHLHPNHYDSWFKSHSLIWRIIKIIRPCFVPVVYFPFKHLFEPGRKSSTQFPCTFNSQSSSGWEAQHWLIIISHHHCILKEIESPQMRRYLFSYLGHGTNPQVMPLINAPRNEIVKICYVNCSIYNTSFLAVELPRD